MVCATTDRIQQRVTELSALGASAEGFVGDLGDPSAASDLVDRVLARWSRLDILVHNAGMTSVALPGTESGSVTMSYETWRASMSRNLDSAFLVAHAAVEPMRAQGWGRIVNVTSVTGPFMAMRGEVAYASAKAGLVGLTRALAVDHARDGITVNAVAPGWIATGSQTPHEAREGAATPIGRSGTPDEVASAITWLTSPSASYITGQCLVIDGGNTINEERTL